MKVPELRLGRPAPRPLAGLRLLSLQRCAKRKGLGVAVNWETSLCFLTSRVSGSFDGVPR